MTTRCRSGIRSGISLVLKHPVQSRHLGKGRRPRPRGDSSRSPLARTPSQKSHRVNLHARCRSGEVIYRKRQPADRQPELVTNRVPGKTGKIASFRMSSHPLRLPFQKSGLIDRLKLPAYIVMLQSEQSSRIVFECQAWPATSGIRRRGPSLPHPVSRCGSHRDPCPPHRCRRPHPPGRRAWPIRTAECGRAPPE